MAGVRGMWVLGPGVRADLHPEFVCPLLSDASFIQRVSKDLGKEG